MTHKDEPGTKRQRLVVSDPIGVYGIECPTSSASVAQTTVFSAPLFNISKFPAQLMGLGRHEALLALKFCPSVFKMCLEGYPGPERLMEWYLRGDEMKEAPVRGGDIPPTITTPKQQFEEVERPSSLASVLKDWEQGSPASGARRRRGGDPPHTTSQASLNPPVKPKEEAPGSPSRATKPARQLRYGFKGNSSSSGSGESSSERSRDSGNSGDAGGEAPVGGVSGIEPGTHGCEVRRWEYKNLANEVEWLRERLVVLETKDVKRDEDEMARDKALTSTFKAVKSDVKKLRQRPQGGC